MRLGDIPREAWGIIDKLPYAQPPPGVTPNLENPTWHGQPVVVSAAVSLAIVLVMACLRIYAKCYIPRKWDLDDYVFLLSLTAALVYISLSVAQMTSGAFGYHSWDIRVGNFTKTTLAVTYFLPTVGAPLFWFSKLAIFSLLYHVFRPIKNVRFMVYAGVVISGLYLIPVGIANGVLCRPRGGQDRIAYFTGYTSPECFDPDGVVQRLSIATGVFNMVVDVYVFLIPLPVIFGLNLPRRRKIGLFLVFFTGIVGCVMTILRLYFRFRFKATTAGDITYSSILIVMTGVIESAISVAIPCMPPAAKAFHILSGSLRSAMGSPMASQETSKESVNAPREAEPSPTNTIDRMLGNVDSV